MFAKIGAELFRQFMTGSFYCSLNHGCRWRVVGVCRRRSISRIMFFPYLYN